MFRKFTKIVATIGPACDTEEMIEKLILSGVDIFRFNFKHNTVEWHNEKIKKVNEVAAKIGRYVGTLIDLQGPEIRINMPFDEIVIKKGEMILFDSRIFETKEKGLSITHPEIINHLKEGQKILAEDGRFTFILKKNNGKTYLLSETKGILKNKKNFNIPGADFPLPSLVERDLEGLKLAQKNEVDFVALSFVRSAEDISRLREEMKKERVKSRVVAKIETRKAMLNLSEIIDTADIMMVARGDLAIEAAYEQVPFFQKRIITESIEKGKQVIVATQMLQSMIENPSPTRAEISDVANAVYDYADAVMLSGETAFGKYPEEAVSIMGKTIKFNEDKITGDLRKSFDFVNQGKEEIITDAAYSLYLLTKEKSEINAFLVFTKTGRTARLISRFKPRVPIIAIVSEKEKADALSINFGVIPFVFPTTSFKKEEIRQDKILEGIRMLKANDLLKKGDKIIVLHGDYWDVEGLTSTIKLTDVK